MGKEFENNNIIADDSVSNTTIPSSLEQEETLERVKEKFGVTPAVLMPAFVPVGNNPDEIKYLILIQTMAPDPTGELGEIMDWCISVGRQNTFDYLKNLIAADEFFDINSSYIISFDDTVSKAKTIFRFMKYMIDSGKVIVGDLDFDIDSYDTGEEDNILGGE